MKYGLLFSLVIAPIFLLAQLTPRSVTANQTDIGFYEFKPPKYDPGRKEKYPLMIFLHGVGERGNGTTELPRTLLSSFPKFITGSTMTFTVYGHEHAFLVLIPQMSMLYMDWENFYVDAMIGYAKANLNVDTNRIFLSGWSVGGGGAWRYATSNIENASRLAGIIPVSPAPVYTNLCNIARASVAVWVHHAKNDGAVPLHFTEDALEGINACSPGIDPIVTYYARGGHAGVADWAFDTLNQFQYPNIYQWMSGTSRLNTRANNKDPVPMAGNDTSIILPSLKTILNGINSYDPNDIILKYHWSVLSGPSVNQVVIEKPDYYVTDVSGLQPGNYIFRLTVTDEFSSKKSDDITVKIILPLNGGNAIPLVDAGPDINTNATIFHLAGTVKDFDGHIQSCGWRQISGPAILQIIQHGSTGDINGINTNGVYAIELNATDDQVHHLTGRDTMLLTKSNGWPVYVNYFSNRKTMKDLSFSFRSTPPGFSIILISCLFLCSLLSSVKLKASSSFR